MAKVVRARMTSSTQSAYLWLYGAALVRRSDPAEVSAGLEAAIRDGMGDGAPLALAGARITMTVEQVAAALPRVAQFGLHLLLTKLDLDFHSHLNVLFGREAWKDRSIVEQLETPRAKGLPEWAIHDSVLLSVTRDCLIHSSGELVPENKRAHDKVRSLLNLLDGHEVERRWRGRTIQDKDAMRQWCIDEVQRVLAGPRLGDYFNFKKAVRKVTSHLAVRADDKRSGGSGPKKEKKKKKAAKQVRGRIR